ncbi:MAG: hypothetical protein AAGC54_16500 [Cyanobacteria bacterium P01_F01_bin.4]
MSAKIQIDNLKQDIATATDETQALKAFKSFTEHLFINHKLYQPETYRKRTWSRWLTQGKKIIKGKVPEIEFPKIWFNRAEVFNAKTDEAMAQALKDACRAQNKAMHNHIWGKDEPKPEPTPTEPSPQQPREGILLTAKVQAAIALSGMDEDTFILKALDAYADSIQGKATELSQLSNDELKGSKKAGHGEALCERAVKAVIAHNSATKDTAARYQITFPVIKTLTGCSTASAERVLGNSTKGVQGTMRDEIAEHHESLGIVSKVYNRGKPPVTDHIQL